ncbi:LOW QUALITY PROTEIN: vacuolar protein sorting-associated protein 13B, partial [Anarrhichthys ocellatus]|uniref:LOW QUALITY PROTEIN: vacuolar protein sorting-associated protein 13B n=1 Tax=Anarrhichthys ocellatus TaxID=433405 RepID=UPI0012ECE8D3
CLHRRCTTIVQFILYYSLIAVCCFHLYLFAHLQELKLPFTFMSGHIHELRIHVPWTKLGSEPVVITINTMECILKLRDGVQPRQRCLNLPGLHFIFTLFVFFLLGVKSPGPSPTLEGSVQNLELKLCSRATVKCASGTVGAVKVCARTPGSGEGVKEKLVPLIQGPSDTKELHMSRWLNEIRRPESLLAPDLLAFSVQVPQQGDDCRNSGAVLLVSVQGIAVNVDPVFCTWLLYQPHRGSGRQQQQQTPGSVPLSKRREDEASVASTPLAKQPSNQASDYASSPVKTKTVTGRFTNPRLSCKFNIEAITMTFSPLQLELQSCCVFLPNDSLPSPSTITCGDIPGTVRSWYHNQASMPGTLVVCLPHISVLSTGHKYMEPLQELPFVVSKPILEEGDAFPWSVSLSQFSVYTLLGQQQSLSLLEPMGCTSTLAVTSHKLQSCSEGGHSFVVCLHVDLQPVHVKCSNPQVQLLYELLLSWSSTWARLQRHRILRQTSSIPEPPAGAAPSSPVRSSAGTALPDTSTCSPSADFGSPTEGDSVPAGDDGPFADTVTLEQKTSSIGGTSGKVSLWMQWMLPKVTVKLFALEPAAKKTEICVICELEDLSASVDVQDVYTKIKCKVGSFNIDQHRCSSEEGVRSSGGCGGVVLSCTDKLNRRTVLVRPVSKQESFSHFSGFFPPTAAKVLEGSHQQHGFLSITYTQAVTKNVRHKLTSRPERGGAAATASQRLTTDPLADSSPQYLREILLTAQPFDVVLSCPLLATVAGVFQATVPRRYRERGKSAGQPMRSHTLTSRCLPLMYINTSVIRVFCPGSPNKHAASEPQVKREDTLVLKLGSLSMAPQADNPLTRTVLRKDIYQRALHLGILRDPGSEVEDRQYQVDLQSINIGTAQWEQLKPEKEGTKGGVSAESERSSQNPALEWNMASSIRRHQERRAILTPILTDFSVRVTAAPAIIFSKNLSPDCGPAEEVVVCGHSLEVNVTSSLDFYLSVAQVQLLQQLLRENLVGMDTPEKSSEVRRCEQKRGRRDPAACADSSSRHSGTGQDSGFGSDSARIRIVQIEQQSGASHHRIARPSRKSTITKNLSFIPFDVFLTAGKLSVMTYACSSAPKALPSSLDTPSTPEQREPGDKVGKSALNQPEVPPESPPVSASPAPDPPPAAQDSLAGLTAEDILNSNNSRPASPLAKGGLLSLGGLPTPSRSSARQALGVTIVRQPGRRGVGDQVLEPLLYIQVMQPSALLSCHHRKQRMELSVFDVALRGVASDYKCLDPGKTLPESLDYNVFWLQTVAGESDIKTGIPPPLLCLQIKDFLNGPAELNVELSRPLKVNPTLAKLEQAKAYLKKVLPNHTWDVSGKPMSAPSTPHSSPTKTPRAFPSRSEPHHQASAPGKASSVGALALSFHKVSLHTAQIVVVMETEAHPMRPSVTVTVSAMTGSLNMKSGPRIEDAVQAASVQLELRDLSARTGLRERSRLLLGPFSSSASLEARWCRHSGSPGSEPGPPKLLLDLKGGLLQVFWGQEHLSCVKMVEEHLRVYLNLQKGADIDPAESRSKGKACPIQPPPSPGSPSPQTEHSSDDLRTGHFQFIQDSASQRLPGPHEVVFYSETEDSPGVMLWRYPEPRVLTFVRITPVPFNTTEDPEISTADLGDTLQVPCSLEYWDELQQAFVPFREFSLSESSACQLPLPSLSLTVQQKELVASDLWRIVLNNNGEGGDEQSSESESGSQLPCDQLVSPIALAACTRVDSCFAPWFVPSLGMSLQLAQLDIHLCHHLEQLGTAPPRQLRPFLPDRKLPQEQEFMVSSAREPRVFLRQWSSGPRQCQEFSFSTQLDCKLLEYRNLTHLQLLQPCVLQGQAAATCCPQNTTLDVNVFVDPVFLNISQYAIHTVDTALHSWQQVTERYLHVHLIFKHTPLVNNTPYTIQCRPLLAAHPLGTDDQACEIPETALFSLAPSEESSLAKPCSLPCWDLLQTSVQGTPPFPLPLKHMLFSLFPVYDGRAGSGSAAWSLPIPVRPDFPRQSFSVPGEPDSGGGLSSRGIVLTYQEHFGVTYIILNKDPCPRMLIHNKCPIPLLLKETVKETPRTEVHCCPLPANCSLHHELYHHFSSFPECRQKDTLPALLLKTTSDHGSTSWTDPIDINCPGTQVVFLPGFGCLYIDVVYQRGTLVLCLAPESSVDAVINQHSRSFKLSTRVLLSEASVVLSDDITNPSGSVELLRLTLTKLLLTLAPAPPPELVADPDLGAASVSALMPDASLIEVHCSSLQVDNQLYNRASFHFPVLLCQDQRVGAEPGGPWSSDANPTDSPEALEEFKRSCFLQLRMTLAGDRCTAEEITFQLQPARVYLEDTFVYYIKTLFHTYIPDSAMASATAGTQRRSRESGLVPILPEQVLQSVQALVHPVRLQRLTIQPVNLLVSIHASLKLYIASDHTPLSFSLFERGPLCTTARQLVHALAMHYAAGALFRAGWVVGSLDILGSPASLVRSIGNGVSDFFRLPYEGLTRGPGAFVSGVSRGTTSFVKHISKGTLTSITNLATSLARNMDRLSLDEEHYTRQEEWRRQLPESLGDGLRQGLSRLGISLLGAIAGIVDQPMQNFQRNWELQSSAGSKAKGVISGVGKGIVGVFTKPIGGAAELVSQTGYGILHGAGLWQLPKHLYLPTEEKSSQAPNSHLKYVWKMLQSLGRPELHMALEVTIVSGSGQEHAGCLLLTSEVLFVVSLSEDTQQQAFPITEVECQQQPGQQGQLTLTLQQQTVASDTEGDGVRERLSEQQYRRLVDYVTRASQFLSPSAASLQQQLPVTLAEPPPSVTKSYRYLVCPAFAKVFVSKFTMVKNKALRIGFH